MVADPGLESLPELGAVALEGEEVAGEAFAEGVGVGGGGRGGGGGVLCVGPVASGRAKRGLGLGE